MAGPVWGTAEIRVTADGKGLVAEIRKQATEAGEAAGTSAGDGFNKKFDAELKKNKGIRGFFKRLNEEIKENGNHWRDLSHNTRQWTLIIGAVAAALPGLATLTSAAAVGVLALGSAITALGVGVGVTISTFMRFTGDIKKLPKSLLNSRKAFDKFTESFSELNEALTERAFADTVDAWESLRKTVKGLQGPLGKVADVVNDLIKDFAKNLAPGTKNFENLMKIIEESAGIFDSLARTAGTFGGALLDAFADPAMQRAVQGLAGWLSDLAEGFSDFVNSPAYSEWVNNGVSTFQHLGELIGSLGDALSGLFDKQTTDDLNDFMDSLGDFLEGPGKSLIEFLDQLDVPGILVGVLNNLGAALKPILDFATAFIKANPELVKKGLEGIATALLAIAGVKIATTIAGPLTGLIAVFSKDNTDKTSKFGAALAGVGLAWTGLVTATQDDPTSKIIGITEAAAGFALIGSAFGGVGALIGGVLGALMAVDKAFGTFFTQLPVLFGAALAHFAVFIQGLSLIGQGTNPIADLAYTWGQSLREFFTVTLPTWWQGIVRWFQGLSLIGKGTNPIADLANEWGKSLRTFFTVTLPGWWNGIVNWFKGLSLIGKGSNPIADLAADWGRALNRFLTVTLPGWWQGIVNFFSGKSLGSFIGTLTGGGGGGGAASGTILYGPRRILAGEAGPEAIVPLNRALSQVDPSVRWLSAIAQGKGTPGMASGGIAGGGKVINFDPGSIIVQGVNQPERAATLVVNRIAERVAS